MGTLTMADFRANLAAHCDAVTESHEPVVVRRGKKAAVVVLSEEDYDAIQETFYLLRSPRNAERLLRSVEAVETGGYEEKDIVK